MPPLPKRSAESGIDEAEDLRSLVGDTGDGAARAPATLGARIEHLLRALFVGRERQLDAFEEMLSDRSSTSLAFVLGELGVGKSALLRRFAAMASQRGSKAIVVDGKVEVVPAALESAVLRLQASETNAPRPVLLVDHVEPRTVRWFIETLLPTMPHDALVVIADRRELSRFDLDPNLLTAPFSQVLSSRR